MWGRLVRAEDAEVGAHKSSERLRDVAESVWRIAVPGADDILAELATTKVGGGWERMWGVEGQEPYGFCVLSMMSTEYRVPYCTYLHE